MAVDLPVHWPVVEEHFDEAGFLWEQWEHALQSPLLGSAEVAQGPEERLCAHLDGLVAAGRAAAERLLQPALREGDPPAAAAATSALLALPDGFLRVRSALPQADGARSEAIVRALGLSRRAGLEREVEPLLREKEPVLALAALEVFAARRLDPGPELGRLLAAAHPLVVAAALRAARWSHQEVRARVERALLIPDAAVRSAAIESGLMLGFRSAFDACRKLSEAGGSGAPLALMVLALGGDPADVARIEAALDVPELRQAALVALGLAGRRNSAERLLGAMEDPALAQLAGEAFSAITGIAIEGALRAEEPPEPEGAEIPAPGEPGDRHRCLVPGAAPELPWPAADAVRAAWASESKRLDASVRHVRGRPASVEALFEAFRSAPMRWRHLRALELAVRSRGAYQIDTFDWALEQLREQERRKLVVRSEARQPFRKLLLG